MHRSASSRLDGTSAESASSRSATHVHRMTAYSLAHVDVLRTRSADLLARAQAIDAAGLSAADRLDQQLLVRTLSDQLESIRLKNFEMPLNQMDGVRLTLPQIATIAPFDSVAHYRDYIARLNAIPVAINDVIERSRRASRRAGPTALPAGEDCRPVCDPGRRGGSLQSVRRSGRPHPGVFPGGRSPATPRSHCRRRRWEGPPGLCQAQDVHRR